MILLKYSTIFHVYIIKFLKYRQTQVSPDLPGFCFSISLSLYLSLLALLCVASICFKRVCLIICCITTPHHALQNDRSSARTSTIWTGVLLFTFSRKIATNSSETILFHVMPLQNDRSLSKPYKMGCCSYFLASHASKGLAPDCAGYSCEHLYFFCTPIIPLQSERSPSEQL